MATNFQRLVPRHKATSTFVPTYFDHSKFVLPEGYGMDATVVLNETNSYFLEGGLTSIGVPPGLGAEGFDGLSFGQRNIFIPNPEYLKNYAVAALGGKWLKDWSKDECFAAVDAWWGGRGTGIGIVTSGANEYNDSNIEWGQVWGSNGDNRPRPLASLPARQQCEWIDERMAQKARAAGGESFGRYQGFNGIGSLLFTESSDIFRTPLSGGQACLDFMKNHAGVSGGDAFFASEQYKVRGGLVNNYLGPQEPDLRRLFIMLLDFELPKKALVAAGYANAPLTNFMFVAKREFPGTDYGFSQRYESTVKDNNGNSLGTFVHYGFTQYSYRYHIAQTQLPYLISAKRAFLWDDVHRRGRNPNVIQNDDANVNYGHFYGSGNPTRKETSQQYSASGAGFFEADYGGGWDATMQGAELFSRQAAWAGLNSVWTKFRNTNSNNFNSVTDAYILDRYQQKQPIARVGVQNNRRWLTVLDLAQKPGTTTEYEFDVVGGTTVKAIEAGVPYTFLGEV